MPGFQISTDAGNTEGPRHIIETARNHRFKLEVLEPFGSTSTGILLYLEKCTRPTPEFDQIVIHNGQDEIYRPGKSRWLPVEFTFYEVLNSGGNKNDAADKIYQWWGQTMLDIQQSSLNPAANFYKRAELAMLDGEGNAIWKYYLYDCWPLKVTPSDLSYADTELGRISVTLHYNKAEEK